MSGIDLKNGTNGKSPVVKLNSGYEMPAIGLVLENHEDGQRLILIEKKLEYVQFYVNFVDEILPDRRTGKKPLILRGKVA